MISSFIIKALRTFILIIAVSAIFFSLGSYISYLSESGLIKAAFDEYLFDIFI